MAWGCSCPGKRAFFVVRATWPDSLQPGISVGALSTRGEKIELVTKVP